MSNNNQKLALPSPSQAAWADAEIGVIIHFDMQVFEPEYSFRKRWGYTPDPKVFNPKELDTDQWIAAAKSAGAKYAVLVAKHCSGFSLWPTKAHSYSVASTPWRGGKGDIVGDFIKSCEKFGLKPGLYASASCNAYMRANNPGKVVSGDPEFLKKFNVSLEMQTGGKGGVIWGTPDEQERYIRAVETQMTELWGNYGKLVEVWFDGGVLPPEQGGPDLVPIMKRLQPDTVALCGPHDWPNLLRTVGNERGDTPDPFWSTTDDLVDTDGTEEIAGLGGTPDGRLWVPGEADMPNRDQIKAFQGGWFWRKGDEQFLYSVDHLTECYFSSVARNTNLLLGMVIDPRGLVPEPDRKRFAEFGEQIEKIFSNRVASANGDGKTFTAKIPHGKSVNMVSIMEDITFGERVRKYKVEALCDGQWIKIAGGTCIGHKRIERIGAVKASELRLTVEACADTPKIRDFSAWFADEKLFNVPMDLAQRSRLNIFRDKAGMVHIECSNPELSMRYTANGADLDSSAPLYEKPFPLKDGGTVKARAFINELNCGEIRSLGVTEATFGCDRSDWKVVSVSMESPFTNLGCAGSEHLLNDDPSTYWHTYHTDTSKSAAPHEVVLDMGRMREIAAFTFMPRGSEATPDQYEFHLSQDGKSWKLAAAGRFEGLKANPGMRLIKLETPMSARYLRFVAKHVLDDVCYLVVAGIGVVESKRS